MRLVLLGAPGSGKGTQAVVITKEFNVPHISTGDIFRYNIKNNTELGKQAKTFIEKGLLVPDEITIGIVRDRLVKDDCKKGFILDGFPRTINQAMKLKEILNDMGAKLDCVLNIDVTDTEIINRISGRLVCSKCGMSYHVKSNPPKYKGICNECNSLVVQREDDKEETIIKRLETYHKETEPLIEYYKQMGLLDTIVGNENIEQTTEEVKKVLCGV